MPPFVASPVDPRLYALLAEAGFGDDVFSPRQHWSCELVEHYALRLAIDLVARLELAPLLDEPRTVEELLAARGFVPGFRPALGWLLKRLVLAGASTRDGTAATGWRRRSRRRTWRRSAPRAWRPTPRTPPPSRSCRRPFIPDLSTPIRGWPFSPSTKFLEGSNAGGH